MEHPVADSVCLQRGQNSNLQKIDRIFAAPGTIKNAPVTRLCLASDDLRISQRNGRQVIAAGLRPVVVPLLNIISVVVVSSQIRARQFTVLGPQLLPYQDQAIALTLRLDQNTRGRAGRGRPAKDIKRQPVNMMLSTVLVERMREYTKESGESGGNLVARLLAEFFRTDGKPPGNVRSTPASRLCDFQK